MPAVASRPAKKLEKDIVKINTRLMEENMTLKRDIDEQRKLIVSMRARKSKAHRRLKALRELNKHVELLQTRVAFLVEQNDNLHMRLITRVGAVSPKPSLFESIFGKRGW